MNIKQTIITAAVALTMVAMIAPMSAGAATVPAQCVNIFTRNLRVGSTGTDVWCMQVGLNSTGYPVAASGAGSPGHETTYFGPRTLQAVRAWQAAMGWTPANQIGPLSRAKLNAWSNGGTTAVVTPPPAGLPAGCTSASGYSPVTGMPCSSGVPVVTNGAVSAMLASDTPAAGGSVVQGQATADLLHVNFTGSGTITSVTLNRSGISDQNTLTNVYLFDGNTRITDGYSFNSSGQIVINGLNIAVSGSHEISVRADVAATAASTASTIAVSLTGYTANGTASTANIQGNMMYVVVGNLATAAFTTANSSTASANVNAGTSGYSFWNQAVNIGVRSVWLKGANFKMIGSAPSDAVANLRFYVDGVDTGKTAVVMAINGSTYATFDLTSAPVSLTTGSHTLEIRGDIQKGTNRNVQFILQQASDLTIFDSQIGVNVALTASGSGSIPSNGTTVTILTGNVTVNIDPAFAAMTNVSGGASNAVIGDFIVHAYGENVKLNTLQVNPYITSGVAGTGCTATDATTGAATGTCGLQNVTLYVNGMQVGSQKNFTQTASQAENSTTAANELSSYSLGSQAIFPAGVDTHLQIRADLMTTGSIAYTAGTVKVTLPFQSTSTTVNYLNAQGQNSQNTLSLPTAAITTTGLTIQTGNLVVSKNTAYLNQNISPNTSGVRIGSYTIQNQSSSEAVRLTSYSIATTTATATISNFSALRTSDTTGSGSTPVQFSGTGSGTTSTDTFSVNDTLAPGASMILDVFANTGTATSGTISTTLNVSSIGVVDNLSATSGAKTGQTLTLGTGTLGTPTLKPTVADTTPAQFIIGPSTNGSKATFNFVSTSGASTITELAFQVSGSDANPSQTATQVCVGSVCGSPTTQTVSGTSSSVVKLTGLNLAVPNGGNGLDVPVTVSYATVGTNGVVPSKTSILSLGYAKYNTGSSSSTIGSNGLCTTLLGTNCATGISSVSANTMTMVGSLPVVTLAAGNTQSVNADSIVARVTIANNSMGGATRIRTIVFNVAYSGYNTLPTSATESLTDSAGNALSTFTCTDGGFSGGAATVTCTNTTATYATDYPIGNTPQEFDLHMTTAGAANTTGTPKVGTTLSKSGFKWDDTSSQGTASGGGDVNIAGTNIYNFPTTSVSN